MRYLFVAALFALTATTSVAHAQVPPDIAEGIRKIGPIVDAPGTAKLYAPLFATQKEPYPNVTVVRDVAYGADPLQKLDVFTAAPTPGAPKPVVVYLHSGGLFERGDKRQPGSPFFDNIMLWLTRQDMVGGQRQLSPGSQACVAGCARRLGGGGALDTGEHRAVRRRSRSPRALGPFRWRGSDCRLSRASAIPWTEGPRRQSGDHALGFLREGRVGLFRE